MLKIKKGDIRILEAMWHSRHGELVEIIMIRKGITEDYFGKKIYHVAFSPVDPDNRREDLDEEFIEKNFKEIELESDTAMICINDVMDTVTDLHKMTLRKAFDKKLIDAILAIEKLDGIKTWMYFLYDTVWISFGQNKEEAIESAPLYFASKIKYMTKNKMKK